MKRILLGIGSLLVFMCLSGIAQAVMIAGTNWRLLSDTVGVGMWDLPELEGIYHTGEHDVKAGYLVDPNADNTINGIDFNGYVWASGAEVLHAFQCLTDEFPYYHPWYDEPDHRVPVTGTFDYFTEDDSVWAPIITDTFGTTWTDGSTVISAGWTRDRAADREPNVYTDVTDGPTTDGYFAMFARDDVELFNSGIGVWMYEASPVPEASSILLVSTALITLAGFRKKFKK